MKKTMNVAELGMLILTGIGMLGSFWFYCETHFAHADAVADEVESRKELKAEVDALYLKLIPGAAPLRHKEGFGP